MNLKYSWVLLLSLALSFVAFGQTDNGGIKQDTKDAANSTAAAAKKTGRKAKHGTKKIVTKGTHGSRKGAGKTEDKTQTPPSQNH